jgi:hypothetical protein
VQLATERATIESMAPRLASLHPAALDALDRRLASLPPGGSLEACVKVERELGIGWAIGQLRKMNDQDPWKDRVLAPYVMNEGAPQPGKLDALVAAAGGTRQGALGQFELLLGYYDEVGKAIALPRDEFRAKLAELEKRTEGNAFAAATLPAMARVYDNDAAGRTRLTMLRAAVAVLRGGPEKARGFTDATGSPLEYRPAPGGFELTSKVIEKDKPVTLKVGGKQ